MKRDDIVELRRSHEQFRLLVQGVADYAIYMLDQEGNVSSWNSGAERIKGYMPDEIVGRHYSAFFSPEDVARREPWSNLQAAKDEGRLETEGWRVRKDGSRFWAHVVLDRIDDESGKFVGFAKVTRDVTEQRATARALEQAREALFQSQKLEAIGQLTGGVAHDFNNLLMAIHGNLELLTQREDLPAKARTLVTNALSGVRRGVALTQRMLAFARRQRLQLEPVNLADLVYGMSDLMRTSLGPSVMVEASFPLSLPAVLVDPNQFELCLLNLGVNARDAMPDGGTVTISGRVESVREKDVRGLNPGEYVKLSVADTGEGMDAETLARATEPFFTTKGVGKGTGLGLSMVHGIVQQCGGALLLSSTPSGGTTVDMWLPVAIHVGSPVAQIVVSDPPGVTAAPSGGKTILVVDDDPLVLSTTVEMLCFAGYDAAGAASAKQALSLLGASPGISVVVTDHAMPGMTGVELAAQLAETHPGMHVILASGYAELPGDTPGVRARLQKPYGRSELLAAIRQA
ncbi:PAS domain S-box-containing protein [Luteibacter jiangsuensis]|uniref:histidine kinase n=1 Tax=Luteibacter jiangsuensis TaxID=637577 RepID=A0ABT9T284_9GAMM|nr:PAS domain-containing sensor histidine kinase [Luteibacter jiangsuensis]MDQ0010237.1 PAS domain S-box-containing protein [Luteibacter jiangsuensis]